MGEAGDRIVEGTARPIVEGTARPKLTSIAMIGLTIVACWIAAGCGGVGSEEATIALLLPNEEAPRGQPNDRSEFEREVKELCDSCAVIYRNAEGNMSRQQAQAERAINRGADALVIDPVDREAATPIAEKARSRGVPTISYDDLILNAKVDYFVSVDSEALGKAQTEALVAKLTETGHPHGPIVMITIGIDGLLNLGANQVLRANRVRTGEPYGPIEPLFEGSRVMAGREMRHAIAKFGRDGFAGVYAADDKAAAGAIAAMKSVGIDPETRPTTGGGASVAALRRVLSGKQYMTVYEGTKEEADIAAEMAVELVRGQEVQSSWITAESANGVRDVPSALVKPTAVTKGNIEKTVVANGFVDPTVLCEGAYGKLCAEAGIRAN